jgi:hypothetical protein
MTPLPRLLLGSSATILVVGAFMHTSAFDRVLSAVAASNLEPFFGKSLKALWLIDSATLVTLAIIFGLASARPGAVSRVVIAILACIPAATAVLLYMFLGPFVPAHMLLVAAVAALFGALCGREA